MLDDVDPQQAAADVAYGCFSAMGQLCVSMERIYVQRSVSGPFTRALVDRLRSAELGSSLDYRADFGSLATAAQLERVQAHLDDALSKGAMVLAGGRSSRLVRIGDQLRIVRDRERHDVAVVGIPTRRGPAPEARLCYSESEESIAARQHARELARLSTPGPSSRPDKRDRRELIRTVKRGG